MMPGNRLKTMFGLFIVYDHNVETYMCDWWIIDFNRVSKFWSLILLRDRKPEYILGYYPELKYPYIVFVTRT